MYKKVTFALILILIAGILIYVFLKPSDKSLSHAVTNVMFIRFALLEYAQKHDGSFPLGKSSTEVFQQLIDDHDLTAPYVYFELPGKTKASGDKLASDNVCFDFTRGTDIRSPNWVPLVLPTGYSINYTSGEAVRLSSNKLNEDVISVAYIKDVRDWSNYMFYWMPIERSRIFIMPGKPSDAHIEQYQQLNP